MSETVFSKGQMAPLSRQLTDLEREDFGSIMYDNHIDIRTNYDGTLIFSDVGPGDIYGIHFNSTTDDTNVFENPIVRECLDTMNVSIDFSKMCSYSCVWYNGTDADMSLMSAEEFLEQSGQK